MKQVALKDLLILPSCSSENVILNTGVMCTFFFFFLLEKTSGKLYQLASFILLGLMSDVILNGLVSVSPQKASTFASRFGCKVQEREKCHG